MTLRQCIPSILFIFTLLTLLSMHKIWYSQCADCSFDQLPLLPQNISEQNEITVVTAYFPLEKAKHSQSDYQSWLKNLFSFCQSPMIIFTTTKFHSTLYQLRRNGSLPSFFVIDYPSPLHMPPIKPLISTFQEQHQQDPEYAYHSIELYAVWCAKSFMLNRSTELNPFNSRFFLYMDAGAFRSRKYRFQAWPNLSTLLPLLINDRYLLGMIAPLPRRLCPLKYQVNDGPLKIDLIEGTFMAGSIDSIHWWTSMYYDTINDYRSKKFFIGKDQSVMNVLALVYANRVNMFLPFRLACDDVWFAFGPLFSQEEERKSLGFSRNCRAENVSDFVIPFENVCDNTKNLV